MALLMIFTFLCPVIYSLIKNKYVGIATVCVLYLLDILPFNFPKTTWPMFQWRTIVYCLAFYLVGGLIGRYGYNYFCKKPCRKHLVLSIALYIIAVIVRGVTQNSDIVFIPMILIGFFSIWILTGVIKVRHPDILALSFFIYPAHTFVLPCVNKLLFLILPRIEWMSIVNTVLGTALSFIICLLLGMFLRKILPAGIWMALNGGRI
jgi:hypothetical protein